jgi:hypothetical protein
VAFFGDSFRTLLCLTALNMVVLICHSTAGWNALKLFYHAEAWRRGTEFMDLNWNVFKCVIFVLQITFPLFPSSSPLWTIAQQGFFWNSLVMSMLVQRVAQLQQICNPLNDRTSGIIRQEFRKIQNFHCRIDPWDPFLQLVTITKYNKVYAMALGQH